MRGSVSVQDTKNWAACGSLQASFSAMPALVTLELAPRSCVETTDEFCINVKREGEGTRERGVPIQYSAIAALTTGVQLHNTRASAYEC